MKKIIAAMNMSLDGFCDHTEMNADDELHEHYNELMGNVSVMLYGRITYQLMESYWPDVVKNPTGNKSTDDFGVLMDDIPKIVFSRTLKDVTWRNSTLKKEINKEEILAMKQTDADNNKNIYVGSPGLIVALTQMGIIDEYQLCVHPVILGKGLTLFKNIHERVDLNLLKTKTFNSGSVVHYYETVNDEI